MNANGTKPHGSATSGAPSLRDGLPAKFRQATAVMLLLALASGLWIWFSHRPARATAGAAGQEVTRLIKGNHGPWGELEYIPILLETPDEFLSFSPAVIPDPVWTFRDYSVSALAELFSTAGVSSQEREWLLDQRNWRPVTNGFAISPPPEMLMGVNRAAREQIYAALAECGGNPLQEMPLSFRSGGLDDWFYNSGLSAPTIALTKSLIYQRGGAWCLSDWPLLLRFTQSPGERRRLLKTTSRQATVMPHLRITPAANVEQLAQYWGRGGRLKDIRPLVESLAQVPEGVSVDIVHFLPRVVRSRIYTYPHPSQAGAPPLPNSFWVSLNFFASDKPNDKLNDPDQVKLVLGESFFPIEEDFLLGDVLLLSRMTGELLNAAVFIADDIVVTMSGTYPHQPWVFLRINDLLASHPSAAPLKVRAYRRKDL